MAAGDLRQTIIRDKMIARAKLRTQREAAIAACSHQRTVLNHGFRICLDCPMFERVVD